MLWLRSDQEGLIRSVVEQAGLSPQRVGSPEAGRSAQLAAACSAEPIDDLRAALATASKCVAILADPGVLGTGGPGAWERDRELLEDARERGVIVCTLEPLPASVLEFNASGSSGTPVDSMPAVVLGTLPESPSPDAARAGADLAVPVPLTRFTQPLQEIAESMDALGAIRSMSVTCCSSPVEGSLGARLLDALDVVSMLMGEPELIDASFCSAGNVVGGRALHALPSESLRGLHGDLTANLRFAGGRSACVHASDQAGRYDVLITLLGTSARVHVDGLAAEWISLAGHDLEHPKRRGTTATSVAALMAQQIKRCIDSGTSHAGAVDLLRVLAIAQAALLSARTGEAERPETMRRMAGG